MFVFTLETELPFLTIGRYVSRQASSWNRELLSKCSFQSAAWNVSKGNYKTEQCRTQGSQWKRAPRSLHLYITSYSGRQVYETAESDCIHLSPLSCWNNFQSISIHSHHYYLKNSSKRNETKPPFHFQQKFRTLKTYSKYNICGSICCGSIVRAMIKF